LRYPQDAMDNCQTGYLLMKFEVDSTGRVSNVEKLFGEYSSIADEAKRVIQKSDGKWNKLFSKNTVVLVPFYFMYERREGDRPCDSIRPPSVRSEEVKTASLIAEKQVLIPNGVMLNPITIIGYGTVRKVDITSSSNRNK
jgi:hypothetical protein